MINQSLRSTITPQEYLMLVGLKTLAMEHERQLKNIAKSIQSILMETGTDGYVLGENDFGWAGELAYTEKEVDEVLKILKLEVKELE